MIVTANNITLITSSPGFADDVPPPPSVGDLLTALTDSFSRISSPRANSKKKRASASLKYALNNIPPGFSLVPVFYDTVSARQKRRIEREYKACVAFRALAHEALTRTDALRQIGVSPDGLEEMRNGQFPRDTAGYPLPLSLDHIICQARCGKFGKEQEKDPDLEDHIQPKYRVNHMGNIRLISNKHHDIKNRFEALQQNVRKGWVVTIAPME